jgi:phenylacetic acid degradation operon negative regulatory protein
MTAKTQLLLYRMEWLVSKVFAHDFRSLDESFEGWAYSNGLLAQIHRLEAQGYLEAKLDPRTGKRLHRLTEAGRIAGSGPRNPEAAWATPWDGKWRLFLFDIPEAHNSKRRKLTRALAAAGCGCIQGSVWLSPSAPPSIEKLIEKDDPECSQLMMLMADSKGAGMDAAMVKSAWNFTAINKRYELHMSILATIKELGKSPTHQALVDWTHREHQAWHDALVGDPLLPELLLPGKYLGQKALHLRRKTLPKLAGIASKLPPVPTA